MVDADIDAVAVRGRSGAHSVLDIVPPHPDIWAVIHRCGDVEQWSAATHPDDEIVDRLSRSLLERHGTAAPIAVCGLGLAAERLLARTPFHLVDATTALAVLHRAHPPEELTIIREGIRRAEHHLSELVMTSVVDPNGRSRHGSSNSWLHDDGLTYGTNERGLTTSIRLDAIGYGGYPVRIEWPISFASRGDVEWTASAHDQMAHRHLHARLRATVDTFRAGLGIDDWLPCVALESRAEQHPGSEITLGAVSLGAITPLATGADGRLRSLRDTTFSDGDVLALELSDLGRELRLAAEVLITNDAAELLTHRPELPPGT